MVISCGNLPSELYHGPRAANYARMPLGYQIPPSEGRKGGREGRGERGEIVARVAVGLDGGDITKMSENVTHLIIYAPRSRRCSLSLSLPPFLSPCTPRHPYLSLSFSLSLSIFLSLCLLCSRAFSGPFPPPSLHRPAAHASELNPPAAVSPPHSREKLI